MAKILRRVGKLAKGLLVSSLAISWLLSVPLLSVEAYGGGYALDFDGVDDYIMLSATQRGHVILGASWTSSKSVSLWVRPTSPGRAALGPTGGDLIAGNMSPRWWGISHADVPTLGGDKIWVFNWDTGVNSQVIGIDYTVGEWAHIALVHDGINLSAYKNGVLVGSIPSGPTYVPNPPIGSGLLFFGGSRDDLQPGNYIRFKGQIDEAAYWSVPLSTAEIRDWMYREIDASHPEWSNLKAYYSMSNGSGATVTDDSSNAWDAPISGGALWVTSGAFSGPRNGLDFDGVDDSATVSPGIGMPANLTMEAWVFPRDVSSGQKWIAGEDGGAQLTMDGTQAQFRIHDGVSLIGPATATLVADQWQHIAGVYDGSMLKIFVDGLEGSSISHSGGNVDQAGDFTFGANGGAGFNNAILDEVRVWSSALSRAQIHQNMAQALKGDEAGLLAYYRMDQYNQGDQNVIYDATGNSQDGAMGPAMDPSTDWVASSAFTTWIGGDSADTGAAENWSRSAVPTASDNVGIVRYPGSHLPSASAAFAVKNLVIAANASLAVNPNMSLNVTDTIYNYGTLRQTLTVDGSGAINFMATGGYGGVIVNPNGQNLGDTTVTIRGHQECTDQSGEAVQRCFDLSSANAPANATLTFYFDENEETPGESCSSLQAYHWEGNWVAETLDLSYASGGHDCAAAPRSLRVTGVDAFSPFVLASPPDPTAVSLVHFGVVQSNPVTLWVYLAALLTLSGLGLGYITIRRKS